MCRETTMFQFPENRGDVSEETHWTCNNLRKLRGALMMLCLEVLITETRHRKKNLRDFVGSVSSESDTRQNQETKF